MRLKSLMADNTEIIVKFGDEVLAIQSVEESVNLMNDKRTVTVHLVVPAEDAQVREMFHEHNRRRDVE